MDDFQLDAETLRKIEEDARRQVEAELDVELGEFDDIDLDGIELDAETLRKIEEEALLELNLATPELDDVDTPVEPEEPLPSPLPPEDESETAPPPASQSVADEATVRAKPAGKTGKSSQAARKSSRQVRQSNRDVSPAATGEDVAVAKAKKAAVARAKKAATGKRRRSSVGSAAALKTATSVSAAAAESKENRMFLIIFGLMIGSVAVIALVISMTGNRPAASPKTAPKAPSTSSAGAVAESAGTAWKALEREMREIRKKQNPANLKAGIDKLVAFKTKYPDYEADCDKQIAVFEQALAFLEGTPPAKNTVPK